MYFLNASSISWYHTSPLSLKMQLSTGYLMDTWLIDTCSAVQPTRVHSVPNEVWGSTANSLKSFSTEISVSVVEKWFRFSWIWICLMLKQRYSWRDLAANLSYFSWVWVFCIALFFLWLDFKKKLKAEVKAERSFQFPDRWNRPERKKKKKAVLKSLCYRNRCPLCWNYLTGMYEKKKGTYLHVCCEIKCQEIVMSWS